MTRQKSVKINAIYNAIFQILIYAVPLITTPYVSRVLGADHVGQYSYALSIVTYFTLFATLGSGIHGQRAIAFARDNKQALSNVFWNNVAFRCITTVVALLLYFIFTRSLGELSVLQIVVSLNIINVVFDVTWFFQGIEDFRQTAIRGLVIKLLGLIGIFLFVKDTDDTCLYAAILLSSTILGNIFLWVKIPQFVNKPKTIEPFINLKDIILVFLPTVAAQVYMVLDKSMIGFITHSDYQNGCYEQAEKLVRVAVVLISSVSTVILPRIANLYSKNKLEEAKAYLYKAYRVVLLLAFPVFFGLIVCASVFLPIYLGPGYDLAVTLMQLFSWLLIVVSLASLTGLAYLIPTKQQNVYTISVAIAAVVNFVMNIIMIPRIGAYGATIASITSETIGTTIQIWYCVKSEQLQIERLFLPSWKYMISSLLMFFVLLVIKQYFNTGVISLLILFLSGSFIYGLMILALKDSLVIYYLRRFIKRLRRKCLSP